MLTYVEALCNAAIGALLAVVVALIAPLFFSGQTKFGLVLGLLVMGVIALVLLLGWFDGRIKNALFARIGLPTAAAGSSANAGGWPRYSGAVGFCLGLAASAVWTPGAVLAAFRALVT